MESGGTVSERADGQPGVPIIDPTRNVLALVKAATKRADDLREAERRYYEASLQHIRETATLHAAHQAETLQTQAEHQRRLDAAESARIDSIREVDRLATATTAMQSRAETTLLAQSQATLAETLRASVSNTATTLAATLANTVSDLNKRIASLEQSSYEGLGKSRVSDPALDRLTTLVEQLAAKQSQSSGMGQGANMTIVYIAMAITAVVSVGGLILALLPRAH